MIRYIVKRILLMIPVIIGVTWLIFTIMYFTPGDPAQIILGSEVSTEVLEAKREELGLNKSYVERFVEYAKDVYFHFDFGESYMNGKPVIEDILQRFPYTLRVASISVCLALLIGIPLGVIAAVNQYSWKDNASMLVALVGISMPGFWVGQMLSLLFALKLGLLPASGVDGAASYILPCLAIGLTGCASIARQTRSAMLEVIRQDYIVTARAKGIANQKVIFVHGLRNALIPVATQAGTSFGTQLGGAIVAESVFSIPGIGTYMMNSISSRDYPAIQGSVIFVAVVFSLVMLLVDLVYAFIDPRIKAQYAGKKRRK
ncbi:ABC transporter permease [Hominifimenecus sp. rT4P-3]|uniref:ABC transporter permease n=1 Tax=Hominifimenecus sp. rT4P-3 TaxID=3242979 RepID=UPI003DA4036C